jgi:hypothetical protein|tara:strand:- start:2762 stop:3412 length:651 start_codon:yes stop_codon:yes gene_type:complete
MSFINTYGGRGLGALDRALANHNMTIRDASRKAQQQGFQFGPLAQDKINKFYNTHIGEFGGNTAANTAGLASVQRAIASGFTPEGVQARGVDEGITWGEAAQKFFDDLNKPKKKPPQIDIAGILAQNQSQLDAVQSRFQSQMTDMQNRMLSQQQTYQNNLTEMKNTLAATQNPMTRESVLGVKGAGNDSSNTAKLNRQGMKGSFARTGLRIKSLNI